MRLDPTYLARFGFRASHFLAGIIVTLSALERLPAQWLRDGDRGTQPIRLPLNGDLIMARTLSLQLLGRVIVVAILALLAIWILWRFLPALGWAAVLAIATWPLRERLIRNSASPTVTAILLTLVVGLVI